MAVSKTLTSIRSLTVAERTALKKAGIHDTKELLDAAKTPAQEKALAARVGISADAVREAVNRADLLQLSGMGAARADLFENAGVNSAAELAQRNATALRATLEKFAAQHPELDVHLPSPATISSLVAKAKAAAVVAPVAGPVDEAKARELATAGLHEHIDHVLFDPQAPAGARFRAACLDGKSPEKVEQCRAEMHADVANFFTSVDFWSGQDAESFQFASRLWTLYTEVRVAKADGKVSVGVEID